MALLLASNLIDTIAGGLEISPYTRKSPNIQTLEDGDYLNLIKTNRKILQIEKAAAKVVK